jgi:ferredoxin
MDMHLKPQDQLAFHLTGKCQGDGVLPTAGTDLIPALLAPYRDLNALRHDFPVVLVQGMEGPGAVRSLSSLIDGMLKDVAPRGVEGERLRRHALQLEREIRTDVARGAQGRLSELWEQAAARLGAREGETLEQVLRHAGGAVSADGPVVGCTQQMPAALLTHAWQMASRAKAKRFQADLSRLVLKLSDILRAARSHSQAGRQPESLKAAIGGSHQDAFDFEVLSRLVGKGVPRDELPPARRERLVRALGVLEGQRFFPAAESEPGRESETLSCVFDNCAAAAQSFRERLGDVVELVKAVSIAELEARGHYVEAEHDLAFEAFDAQSLTADDLARFPDYLVCIPPDRNDAPENANLLEMLSSGLPAKVLVQTSELLQEGSIGAGHFAFGVRSARLATAAMGLGGMFVLQSSGSNLHALRAQVARGLACGGPALFSVYSAADPEAGPLAPYLMAAAAMQSRAYPAFTYDASAGSNWATRFSLENNPCAADDWATESLAYSDMALQRATESCAFTFADFALCDRRYAAHFAQVPRERWHAAMLPVADWLALAEQEAQQRVPYLLAVDGHDALHRVIVDARLMQATRRCLLLWRRLQEHGSPPQVLIPAAPPTEAASKPAEAPAPAPSAEAAVRSRDEAWIDTARCPSCNECQHINERMFGYDERKQAFIKDLAAGTYRQLVEAAESCQVAIIHPGKPRDGSEPGLEELLVRAEPFR